MMIQNARIYRETGRFETGNLAVDGELISLHSDDKQLVDAQGLLLIPGLVDIHLHGCVGHDFSDGTKEAIDAITAYEGKNGVTAVTPASMSLPAETLLQVFSTAAAYTYQGGAMFCGINMEGPFFAAEKKGAQNADYLRTPDLPLFRRLCDTANGMVKIACVAPELPDAMAYIAEASQNTTVSLAHTSADYDTAMSAFAHGARHVTHLFNAMPPLTHRAPGVVGAAFDSGSTVELISDGVHIHPSVIRAVHRLFSPDRVALISDSMMATGMEDGVYSLGGQQVTVNGNKCILADGTIAGSATNLFDCMRSAVRFGIPLEDAVRMASATPAKVIGEYHRMGSLTPGKLANFVLMDSELHIHSVYVKGKRI